MCTQTHSHPYSASQHCVNAVQSAIQFTPHAKGAQHEVYVKTIQSNCILEIVLILKSQSLVPSV